MYRLVLALTSAVLLFASVAEAQTPSKTPCSGAAFRQFDFWIGDWKVYNHADNVQNGTNLVTREYGGCVLQEHWKGTDGSAGSSFNLYDASRKVWHQTWVDNSGGLLLLEGGLVNGSMVLSGPGVGKSGAVVHRITWTPQADGSVRQHWQTRPRKAGAWKDVFDGIYRRS